MDERRSMQAAFLVKMPEEMRDEIRREAYARDVSMGHLVREAVALWLRETRRDGTSQPVNTG